VSQIAVAPFVLKDIDLQIDVDNYEKHVSSAQLVPSVSQQTLTWKGLSPGTEFTDTSTPDITWALQLTFAQDWDTLNSLSQYLLTNAGQTKNIVLQPKAGSGQKTFTVDAVIVPGPVGGDIDTYQTGQVSLPVIGAPAVGTSV
jgi:hypothetical protein